MTKIVAKSLPNAVSYSELADAAVRNKVMLLNENIRALASQLADAQKALVELQVGASKASVDINNLAAQVAPVVEDIVVTESATASAAAIAANESATTASNASATAVSAKELALPAAQSAEDAKDAAEDAQEAAENARDAAQSAAQSVSWSTAISFVSQAISSARTILMEGIVPDTSKTYSVKVLFRNTSATKRSCKVNGEACTVDASVGAKNSKTLTGVPGGGSFTFVNVASTVDVFIFITKEI